MKKVYFLNSWNENPKTLFKRYSKQTPECKGVWKDIQGTTNISDADYCIVLGGVQDNVKFDLDRTIYIKREPDFIRASYPNLKHSVIWKNSHCGITWWLNKTYDELMSMPLPTKKKKISCIVSTKHRHRENFVKRMMTHSDSKVDLYGRGHKKELYREKYKGNLNYDGNCKFLGMHPYEYTVVLENSQQKNYWSEKLADAYLSWSMPIYWGCPNLHNFFDPLSYKTLDIEDPSPWETIREMISKPLSKEEVDSIAESRDKVLNEYNIWEIVKRSIDEIL